ncbi:MAG: asparagine synthetase B family protein, partial [Candidatus Bathyarchaeia archaeon]
WDMNFSNKTKGKTPQLKDELLQKLRASVEERLISDVPLGILLSGGIDSSLIVAIMSQILPKDRVKAFAIGFEEKSYDESKFARLAAESLGLPLTTEIFSENDMAELVSEAIGDLDEPLADPSVVPTFLLSRFARKYVTVVLSGDGGDELFGGYPKYFAHKVARLYDKLLGPMGPTIARKTVAFLARLPQSGTLFKMKRFFQGLAYPSDLRNQMWISPFFAQEIEALLAKEVANSDFDDLFLEILNHGKAFNGSDPIDRMMYLDSKLTFQDMYLAKVDRASMACSLEVRAPFLDTDLIEFASSLPAKFKTRRLGTKYLPRKLASSLLPKPIATRKKAGFGIPLGSLLRNELRELVHEKLSTDKVAQDGFFKPEVVTGLLKNFEKGSIETISKIWTLLVFQIWFENWGVPNRANSVPMGS